MSSVMNKEIVLDALIESVRITGYLMTPDEDLLSALEELEKDELAIQVHKLQGHRCGFNCQYSYTTNDEFGIYKALDNWR